MKIIDCLYNLTSPSRKDILAREKKIATCKERIGDKWLLAIPVTACTNNCNQGRTCGCRK